MVQEVQQQWNWYQTPNEIQGIWNIRRRVKEHTQVTEWFTFQCIATWNMSLNSPDGWWSKRFDGTLSLDSQSWNIQFVDRGIWIRIPQAWIYQITIDAYWMYYWTCRHTLKSWGKILFYAETVGSWTGTATEIVSLWKYNLLEYWWTIWYGSPLGSMQNVWCTVTVKKL